MSEELRTEELKKELSKISLDIRSDSVMCKEYISGKDIELKDVVNEMATMHFLHNYTTYKEDLEKVAQYLVQTKGPFRGVWRNAAQIVKVYFVAKGLPDKWPWIEGQD